MFEKEIEELNKAIKHLETDILPSKCNGNTSCYNEHIQLYKWLKELKSYNESVETQNEFITRLQKELEEERKLNAEIKARFVKCNTCTDEMKSKCLMFTENLCEGERCEELIDIVSLVNKSDLERKIEALEKANEWHYVKDGDLPTKELEEEQLLVRVRNYTEDYIFAYYMLDKYYSKNGKRFYSDTDCDYPIDIEDIIAWKEIVLPELPKEIE